MKNKVIKRRIADVFDCVCMLTGMPEAFNALQYHHLLKKEYGGGETFDNGALLNDTIHKWLHSLEEEYPELFNLINECVDLYKGCIEYGYYESARMFREECQLLFREQYFIYQEQHPVTYKKTRKRRR